MKEVELSQYENYLVEKYKMHNISEISHSITSNTFFSIQKDIFKISYIQDNKTLFPRFNKTASFQFDVEHKYLGFDDPSDPYVYTEARDYKTVYTRNNVSELFFNLCDKLHINIKGYND
jgi:hypothetical protein